MNARGEQPSAREVAALIDDAIDGVMPAGYDEGYGPLTQRARRAILSALAEKGMVVVRKNDDLLGDEAVVLAPLEPTDAMVDAALAAGDGIIWRKQEHDGYRDDVQHVLRSALASLREET